MSVRKRPVITVVDARPMNEVGFRDTRVSPGSTEIPKLSPPPSKTLPVARPPPPANLNTEPPTAAIRRPVSENKASSELCDALMLDNQLKKSNPSDVPPPKPQRAAVARPMTIHVDRQNNILPLEKEPSVAKPIPSKRLSVRTDAHSNDTINQNIPVNAFQSDPFNANNAIVRDPVPRVKPDAVPNRPTIIRVSTCDTKSKTDMRPPPVAFKSPEAKQQAAEQMAGQKEGSFDSSNVVKPVAKPKPAVRPKPGPHIGEECINPKPQVTTDIRKRPTIIRPVAERTTPSSTAAVSTSLIDSSLPAATFQHQETVETVTERVPPYHRTTPTIIRPLSEVHKSFETGPSNSAKQSDVHFKQPEISIKSREEISTTVSNSSVQAKKRPNIIRPNVNAHRKEAESTVTISSETNVVHFAATGTDPSLMEHRICSPVDTPEKQNAENWKRIENGSQELKAAPRPMTQPSRAHVQEEQEKLNKPSQESSQVLPPTKSPPPRVVTEKMETHSDDIRFQSSNSMLSHHGPPPRPVAAPSSQGPPPRPTAAPSRQGPPPRPVSGPSKPARPAQPTTKHTFATGMPPSLPNRPKLGHPLFHYVVSGPHAIALFEYKATQPDELNFKAGEVIVLERWVNSEWLQGRTAKASGMFPVTFVDIIEQPDASAVSTMIPEAVSNVVSSPSGLPGSGPRCCARFDYDGEDPADLIFASGDIIHLQERVGAEWYRGELNGKVGMFPVSFVEIIEDLPPSTDAAASQQTDPDDVATVLFDFLGQPGELSILSGSKVKILSEINSDWLLGESEGQRGRFPRAFVDHVPANLPQFDENKHLESSDEMAGRAHCVALYDFVGQKADDLSFSAGDKILLLAHVDNDWLRGELKHKQGMFPSSFVRVVKDVDDLTAQSKLMSDINSSTDTSPLVDFLAPEFACSGKSSTDSSMPAAVDKPKTAVALYDFSGETAEDLAFHAGETIEIVRIVNDDWIEGKIGGRVGIFPGAFVNLSH